VLNASDAPELWPLIFDALAHVYRFGVRDLALWSYTQTMRDGLLVLNARLPPTWKRAFLGAYASVGVVGKPNTSFVA
jgi:hypothetical protein